MSLLKTDRIELCISHDILDEATRILRDKFHRSAEELRADVMALEAIATRVERTEQVDAVPHDPTDNKILECAVATGSDVIVSGDAHLLGLGSFRGIKVVKVGDFLAAFQARGR